MRVTSRHLKRLWDLFMPALGLPGAQQHCAPQPGTQGSSAEEGLRGRVLLHLAGRARAASG